MNCQLSIVNYQLSIVSFALTTTHALRKLFFFVLVLGMPVFCWAQGEGNVWYFGENAGIDFNSGSAVAISGPILTSEGSAVICNSTGSVLFSTDGVTVFNSLNDPMGTGLFGNISTTQSAIIIPFPANNNMFYIFTADYEAHPHGICYSIVDMTLNGGLGGLVSINNQLLTPACEKLTATRNSNGTGYWVIVHAFPTNEFYAYPVTAAGIGLPVITPIGLPVPGAFNTVGQLKCSPNGQKIAMGYMYTGNPPCQFFDFDATTGLLSNYIPIPSLSWPDGISFSSDNTKLYVSYADINGINIRQFDLTLINFQNLPYTVLQGSTIAHFDLQLAPDGKIYCAKLAQDNLGVINDPNLSGAACNYVDNGFSLLTDTYSLLGLPNFVDNYFSNPPCSINLGPDIFLCGNNSSTILNSGGGFNNYLWSNGDTSQSILIDDGGFYSVTITNDTGCTASDTILVSILSTPNSSLNFITDILNCTNTFNGSIDINVTAGTGSYNYQWSNGATTQDLNNIIAGFYSVTITDSPGCSIIDSSFIILQINDLQIIDSSINNLNCHDDTNSFINVTVLNGLSPNTYTWSNGATTEDHTGLTAGTYSVTVSDAGGCTASDTVVITAPNQVVALLTTAADTVFCSVSGGTPAYHYLWNTGATTAYIDSATNGTYTVTVSDINNCTTFATVTIDAATTIDGDSNFTIYPNPSANQFTVDLSKQKNKCTISIYNLLGEKLIDIKNASGTIQVEETLSSGMYLLEIKTESGETAVKKIVKVE